MPSHSTLCVRAVERKAVKRNLAFSISKNDIFFRAAPIVMVSFLPVVAILFSCDPKAFKTKFQVITAHLKSQASK